MTKQSTAFLDGEADNYFLRNKAALDSPASSKKGFFEIEALSHALAPFESSITSILEIGCSNGAKLERLCVLLNAKGQGIDPSRLAVKEGNLKFGGTERIELQTGTAASLPFGNESFDLVYFGFCLYLLDRCDLFSAVAEADRVLRSGGFLAITDFDPIRRLKRAYHHKDGVFSFKQDYSRLFTESGGYYLVWKNSFSHRQQFFEKDGNERVSTTLLFKETDAY
ncbi:MAG: class I SAM-dependent methyltransferase [Candidatus Sulfotelmatobacter sp.]